MSDVDPMKQYYATKMELLDLISHFQMVHRVILDLSLITLTQTSAPKDQVQRLTDSMDQMLNSFDQLVEKSKKNFPGLENDE